jgi:hypothetical protein
MTTGASEAPIPSRRQESQSSLLCSKSSLMKDAGYWLCIHPFSTPTLEKQKGSLKPAIEIRPDFF